jgi:hypothetical protein
MHRPNWELVQSFASRSWGRGIGTKGSSPVFLTTEHTEHTEINPPGVMLSFRVFGVFRGSLLFLFSVDP